MTEKSLTEVARIHDVSLRDIPGRLRDLADKIESGLLGNPDTCAVVLVSHEIAVFGYGDRSEHDTVGLALLAGANFTARNME